MGGHGGPERRAGQKLLAHPLVQTASGYIVCLAGELDLATRASARAAVVTAIRRALDAASAGGDTPTGPRVAG